MEARARTPLDDSGGDALERLARDAGAEALAREAAALTERVRAGLFYVACVGQTKRGKSTLLNALVGEPVLPTGIVPVTAVLTVLRHGSQPAARVRDAGGASREIAVTALAAFVSEEGNPGNGKGAAAVEVFVPSPLLSSSMCLVDTPGIGSVFETNSETTRAFVPHIDAALVVLGADPPLSGEELTLIGAIAGQCPDLLFVQSKADKLSEAERRQAVAFTRQVLAKRLGKVDMPIFEVSGTERLSGQGPARDWPALVAALETLAQNSGGALVRAAEARGLAILAARLRHHLEEERDALLRPVEESARRIAALQACVAEAERSLGDLGALFTAEHERLGRIFAARKEEFLARAGPEARRELAAALRTAAPRRGRALRHDAIGLAHTVSRRWLDRWLAEAQPAAEALYVEATQRFVELANGFFEHVARSGDPALSTLSARVRPETGFRMSSRLHYTSMLTLTGQTPAGWFLDLLRSRAPQLRALEREVGAYVATLIAVNASRITNDFDDRVLESRRRFQAEVRTALAEVATTAESALARAEEQRAQGSQAVQHELERIEALHLRLEALGRARKEAVS